MTPTQYRVAMECAINGGSNAEIATRMGIGAETVHTHLKAVYKETGLDRERLWQLLPVAVLASHGGKS